MKGARGIYPHGSCQGQIQLRVGRKRMQRERDVYQAAKNRSEDGQRGMPVVESHLLESCFGKAQKEVDEDQRDGQDGEQDDYKDRKDEDLEQGGYPVGFKTEGIIRPFLAEECISRFMDYRD
jgi:hypothetical protein